jgi:FkbM family methyltransferase
MEDVRKVLRRKGLVAVADKSRAEHLQAFGLRPEVVIDVGVDRGTPELYRAFPDAHFILVDPRAETRAVLDAPDGPRKAEFHAVALGARPGRMTLSVPLTEKGARGARASLSRPVGAMARDVTGYDTREVEVTTLDALIGNRTGRLGLKIDTEGFEAAVLEGACATLPRCDFVILELSLQPRFIDTPRPSAVIAMLAAAGLEFRDVLRVTGDGAGGAAPRLFDALFTRWQGAVP